jgi:hypothetical protein
LTVENFVVEHHPGKDLEVAADRHRHKNFPVPVLAAAIATVPGSPATVESPDGRTECDDATERV